MSLRVRPLGGVGARGRRQEWVGFGQMARSRSAHMVELFLCPWRRANRGTVVKMLKRLQRPSPAPQQVSARMRGTEPVCAAGGGTTVDNRTATGSSHPGQKQGPEHICYTMSTAALFSITLKRKPPRRPWTEEWLTAGGTDTRWNGFRLHGESAAPATVRVALQVPLQSNKLVTKKAGTV